MENGPSFIPDTFKFFIAIAMLIVAIIGHFWKKRHYDGPDYRDS